MEAFFLRLVIGIAVIWLIDRIMFVLHLNPRAQEVIQAVTLVAAVIFVVFGGLLLK